MKKKLIFKLILTICVLFIAFWIIYSWELKKRENIQKQKQEIINIWINQLCNLRYKDTEWEKWVISCFEKNKFWEKKENLWTIWTIVRWCYKTSNIETDWSETNILKYLNCIKLFESSIQNQWQQKLVEDVSPAFEK